MLTLLLFSSLLFSHANSKSHVSSKTAHRKQKRRSAHPFPRLRYARNRYLSEMQAMAERTELRTSLSQPYSGRHSSASHRVNMEGFIRIHHAAGHGGSSPSRAEQCSKIHAPRPHSNQRWITEYLACLSISRREVDNARL